MSEYIRAKFLVAATLLSSIIIELSNCQNVHFPVYTEVNLPSLSSFWASIKSYISISSVFIVGSIANLLTRI